MGLIPGASQEKVWGVASPGTSEEGIEMEIFGNISFDGIDWHERLPYAEDEGPW